MDMWVYQFVKAHQNVHFKFFLKMYTLNGSFKTLYKYI